MTFDKLEVGNDTGYLKTIEDNNSNKITIYYEGTRISSVTDGAGREITFGYNLSGRLNRITDPSLRNTWFEYDSYDNSLLFRVTYPDMVSSHYYYNTAYKYLESAVNYDGYKLMVSYYPNSPYRVSSLEEKHSDGTLGQKQ